MDEKRTKIIVTLGPSTKTEKDLLALKERGVDFVRVNMSHSTLEDLSYFINLAKKVGILFIIDTEGSQVRTGRLKEAPVNFSENNVIKIYGGSKLGDENSLSLTPGEIINQLEEGDILHIDFDNLILRISDVSAASQGYVVAKVIAGGSVGNNKAVVIDTARKRKILLPVLSPKDYQSIKLGLEAGVKHIAVSFVRRGSDIDHVRSATNNDMQIISKIECVDALENLEDIISKTDFLLIDRGDLSKEISIERIPFAQKIIINKALKQNKGVFVATNLLETMITQKKPTRAEVNDVVNTILDGASGLTLAAETAIGKYPIDCVNMLNRLIKYTETAFDLDDRQGHKKLEDLEFVFGNKPLSSLIPPHGGKLINRILEEPPDQEYLKSLIKIKLNQNQQMDAEQIAIGTFSPLEGFMNQDDLNSVLDNLRLKSGVVWPVPIILDISEEVAKNILVGDQVALVDDSNEVLAVLSVENKYGVDKQEMSQKLYGTDSKSHPGVQWIKSLQPVLLGGKIDLLKRRRAEFKEYELTPTQVRKLFEERGWSKIVGFHTRNVIHRSHEFIQLAALEKKNCDGLFVHPIVGKKKPGDFNTKYIVQSYEQMKDKFYPKDKVILATFSTFSRYAGPREALFTALCRKNFGCSHFIVGRDHTGVGNFYSPTASHDIFDQFSDLGIEPIKFGQVVYSQKLNKHIEEKDLSNHEETDGLFISGTSAREMLEKGIAPPDWFMRPEISKIIIDALKNGEQVFVK